MVKKMLQVRAFTDKLRILNSKRGSVRKEQLATSSNVLICLQFASFGELQVVAFSLWRPVSHPRNGGG